MTAGGTTSANKHAFALQTSATLVTLLLLCMVDNGFNFLPSSNCEHI